MATTGTNALLKQFGIKEVADVAFYVVGDIKVDDKGAVTFVGTESSRKGPVLTFNTLKVSNLEFTGETAEARGGKGNTVLMSWDHSREATLTLEDALLSVDSLNTMLSNKAVGGDNDTDVITITADGFPGTYTVVGKTYARDADGTDHLLTFVIWKAKVSAEASFEMSADGEPSTLNMTLKVLRADDNATIGSVAGEMVKMIIDKSPSGTTSPTIVFPKGN